MKTLLISIFLIAIVIAGYIYISGHQEQAVAQQHEQREQQIMQKQKQFQDQTRELGQQMQQDLQTRMTPVDSVNHQE